MRSSILFLILLVSTSSKLFFESFKAKSVISSSSLILISGNGSCSMVDLLIAKYPPAKCFSSNCIFKK